MSLLLCDEWYLWIRRWVLRVAVRDVFRVDKEVDLILQVRAYLTEEKHRKTQSGTEWYGIAIDTRSTVSGTYAVLIGSKHWSAITSEQSVWKELQYHDLMQSLNPSTVTVSISKHFKACDSVCSLVNKTSSFCWRACSTKQQLIFVGAVHGPIVGFSQCSFTAFGFF